MLVECSAKRTQVHVTIDARRNCFFASARPAAHHRSAMVPDSQRFTLAEWSLQISIIDSTVGRAQRACERRRQGAAASPLLANVYLHYVFDRWARQWRRQHAHGDVYIVRFADDFVAGFEHREDAQRCLADLRERFAKFGLELHPEKTRLIEFGRFAAQRRADGRGGSASWRRSVSWHFGIEGGGSAVGVRLRVRGNWVSNGTGSVRMVELLLALPQGVRVLGVERLPDVVRIELESTVNIQTPA